MKYTFAEKIKMLRKKQKLSTREMSRRTKMSYDTLISLQIKNRSKTPNIITIVALAKFFKITIDEFLKDVEIAPYREPKAPGK